MKTLSRRIKYAFVAATPVAALAFSGVALGEGAEDGGDSGNIEEVIVTGRFISSSQQLVNERMNDAFSTDLLGADTIARLGDSTVGAALRRVPGLTLVQDKFVYIRGLGERYATTTLNGSQIPSPDLTRNVIPLNVFPTSIVESLRVQKSYSPSISANFGGGAVDIRTKGIPDDLTIRFEAGVGMNSENPSNIDTYPGGGDDRLAPMTVRVPFLLQYRTVSLPTREIRASATSARNSNDRISGWARANSPTSRSSSIVKWVQR
jgi:hypothetical protein